MSSKRYSTQWAAQFFTAAELARRHYRIAFTLGNAPAADMHVVSPTGHHFTVEVKGQASRSFWLLRAVEPKSDLFYILVFLTKLNQPPRYFILTSTDAMKERTIYKDNIECQGGSYQEDLGGFNWSQALLYENKWNTLPQ